MRSHCPQLTSCEYTATDSAFSKQNNLSRNPEQAHTAAHGQHDADALSDSDNDQENLLAGFWMVKRMQEQAKARRLGSSMSEADSRQAGKKGKEHRAHHDAGKGEAAQQQLCVPREPGVPGGASNNPACKHVHTAAGMHSPFGIAAIHECY